MSNFNWEQFHKDLDTALAILLTEGKIDLPSTTTLIQFLELSNAKRLAPKPNATLSNLEGRDGDSK